MFLMYNKNIAIPVLSEGTYDITDVFIGIGVAS